MSATRSFKFEEICRDTPLVIDAVYESGNNGGISGDPFHPLLGVGNRGGFRKSKMGKTPDYAFIVLFTTGTEIEWPDFLDRQTGIFRYYGDNRTIGHDIHDTKAGGNKALCEAFRDLETREGRRHIPPFLLFEKTENGRDVRFLGMAVPGTMSGSSNKDLVVVGNNGFKNYEAHLTVLDSNVPVEWLKARQCNDPHHEDLAPLAWKEFIERGRDGIRPLITEKPETTPDKTLQPSTNQGPTPTSDITGTHGYNGPIRFEKRLSFFDYLNNLGLLFNKQTVEDFLLSLKAKQFLILSGGTGTGKTQLAKAYGEYISPSGLTITGPASTMSSQDTSAKNYLMVPIGSNWTDNKHILGYHNAITDKYYRTPSLNFLMRSNKDVTSPFILILDEMNLSHVERYLSDIISSMESKVPIQLKTTGTNDIPEQIDLNNNLFVVGTVNMDETTYTFSPKVLDRSNVIEFECTTVSKYLSPNNSIYTPSGDVEFLQNCMEGLECRDMKSNEIVELVRSQQNDRVISSLISDLDSIQRIMNDMRLPFGFRTVDEIMRFMYVAWIYEGRGQFTNWKRYMDSQIKQKIMPKIHGNLSIQKALSELMTFCTEHDYPKSSSKLERMVETLNAHRYVSFNV